jgi:hypothetical protein
MKNILYLLIIGSAVIIACSKSGIDNPDCIDKLIETQKQDIGAVYSYNYQGESVYEFTPKEDCCDFENFIYSKSCALICKLQGITGNQICNGDTFYVRATDKTLVWKRP